MFSEKKVLTRDGSCVNIKKLENQYSGKDACFFGLECFRSKTEGLSLICGQYSEKTRLSRIDLSSANKRSLSFFTTSW